MKRTIPILLLLVVASCSSIKTSYDYDKSTDFTKIKTYDFSAESANMNLDQLDRDRIVKAVESEMAARGITRAAKPDVVIDLHIKIDQKQTATATTNNMGGMYGGPWRYGYGGGFTTTQINYNDYLVGTLFINMVSNDKLVWQGRGEKTIDPDASTEKRESNLKNAVNLIFKKYPVQPIPVKK